MCICGILGVYLLLAHISQAITCEVTIAVVCVWHMYAKIFGLYVYLAKWLCVTYAMW